MCPGRSVSQSAHTGITPYRSAPLDHNTGYCGNPGATHVAVGIGNEAVLRFAVKTHLKRPTNNQLSLFYTCYLSL